VPFTKLTDLDVRGKRVLVREDLNVPILRENDEGTPKILDYARVDAAIPTLRWLHERGARTIAVDEKTHKAYLPTAKTAPSASGGRTTFLPNTFKVLVVGK